MSLCRYPGGKSKFKNMIVTKLQDLLQRDPAITRYLEPFFGGGAIGLEFLSQTPSIQTAHLNDRDVGVSCMWSSVIQCPDILIERVQAFEPSVNAFFEFKSFLQERKIPGGYEDTVEIGFQNLAVHRMSYSGLGTMAGGPLGGKHQLSSKGVDSRWNPNRIVKTIEQYHAILASKSGRWCSSFDFQTMIEFPQERCLVYLDPPYFQMGNGLYHCGLTLTDHERLAASLQASHHLWLLSYDDCPEIRELYELATIEKIEVPYSMSKDKRQTELLIYLR